MTKNEHEIAALMDMKMAGAVAFSDGNEISPGLGVLKNVMLYSQGLEGKLMIHPEKRVLSKNGQVNQGIMSLMLGYKGIPKEAEFMAVSEIIQTSSVYRYRYSLSKYYHTRKSQTYSIGQ
jgi:dihydroorotase